MIWTHDDKTAGWDAFLARTGLLLICAGVLCNELLLRWIGIGSFARGDTKVIIRTFGLAAVMCGVLLLVFRRSTIVKKAVLSCSVLAVFLIFIETVFYCLKREQSAVFTASGSLYQPDSILGKIPTPDSTVRVTKTMGGSQVYEVKYRFDRFSRRITPIKEKGGRDRFILFFGGSFTFGEGVGQHDTLPARVARLSSELVPYNYGYSGYGPQQMLAALEERELKNEIAEGSGYLVYSFLDDHVNRAIGSFRVSTRFAYGIEYPYYVLEGNVLSRRLNFANGRPALSAFYRLLSISQTVKFLELEFPLITDRHVETTAAILVASRDRFRNVFGSDEFYVLLFPWYSRVQSECMTALLAKENVKVLDYSDLLGDDRERYFIPKDGHASPLAYDVTARRLIEDLRPSGVRPVGTASAADGLRPWRHQCSR